MADHGLVRQFQEDLEELERKYGVFRLTTGFPEAILLIGALQLSLRHPGMRGETAEALRRLTKALVASVGETETLREVLERGWHEEFDECIGVPADN